MKEKKVLSNADLLEFLQFIKKYNYLSSSGFLKNDISRCFELSDNQVELVDEFNILNWEIFSLRNFNENFLRKFKDKVDWRIIIRRQKLSESFIKEMCLLKKYSEDITKYQKLSEKFLQDNLNYLNTQCMINITNGQKSLSEDFIKKYINPSMSNYIMNNLLLYHKVPEDYLEKYKDHISNWDYILLYQKHISFDFIDKYKGLFKWDYLLDLHYNSSISLKLWKRYIHCTSTNKIKYVLDNSGTKIKNNGLKKLLNQEFLIRQLQK